MTGVISFANGTSHVGPLRRKMVRKKVNHGSFREVHIKALGEGDDKCNTVAVFIGGPNCTANYDLDTGGYPLAPGDSISLPVECIEYLHCVATSSSQVLVWCLK